MHSLPSNNQVSLEFMVRITAPPYNAYNSFRRNVGVKILSDVQQTVKKQNFSECI